MGTQRCLDCGEYVPPNRIGSYREIKGWEMIRVKGGAHSIAMRQETGAVMCSGCAERRKLNERRGIADEQISMNV